MQIDPTNAGEPKLEASRALRHFSASHWHFWRPNWFSIA